MHVPDARFDCLLLMQNSSGLGRHGHPVMAAQRAVGKLTAMLHVRVQVHVTQLCAMSCGAAETSVRKAVRKETCQTATTPI